jgi:hypothetical protein
MIMNKITIFALIISFALSSFAGDYPKPKLEREMDEMGSLAGGEGVVFRPGKEKSTDSRAVVGNVNKYLYQASLDVLKFAPIISADSSSGTIITDWYSPKGQKNVRFKITVYIKDTVISPEGLEVVALQKKKYNGAWPENYEVSPVGVVFEDKILRKARELYQQSKK